MVISQSNKKARRNINGFKVTLSPAGCAAVKEFKGIALNRLGLLARMRFPENGLLRGGEGLVVVVLLVILDGYLPIKQKGKKKY
jgi:hypothetical protein